MEQANKRRLSNMKDSKEKTQQPPAAPAQQAPDEQKSGGKKKAVWIVITLLISVCTIWAVAAQASSFSLQSFAAYLGQANAVWLCIAVAAMLGFIVFEACALRSICGALHHPTGPKAGFLYSAADIYFSAITPSATGGQPACAYWMMRDGIPGTVATAALILNLTMYSLAILTIGLLCFLLRPGVFLRFGMASKVLIVIGYAIQIGLALLFFLMVRTERLLQRLCSGVLRLLGRLHLLRREETLQAKLRQTMADYRQCAALLSGQSRLLLRVFCFNLLQRACLISVPMFVYLAMGGRHAADIWAMQSYVVIGSNCVPVPGAMGVADYLMLDGFGSFLPAQQAVSMELLSRSVSFYCCVLLCGISVLLSYWHRIKKGKNG